MSYKDIKRHNSDQFVKDIKRVRDVVVYAQGTGDFYRITKCDLLRSAETTEIKYYITDTIFVVKRDVMVIL